MCSTDGGLWYWDATTQAASDDAPSQRRGWRGVLSFPSEVRVHQGRVTLHCKSLRGVRAPNLEVPEDAAGAEPFAVEYLQSISLASIPPSCLRLKIGAPIILLHNLSAREGLCNGTRMRVLGIRSTCLQGAIMGAKFNGKNCLPPRIKLTTTDDDLRFILQRTQFPVRLCFAITVNKSQGQSLEQVGVDLQTCAFTHGQLYVALSRVTSLHGLTLLPSDNTPDHTENIVYPEVLL